MKCLKIEYSNGVKEDVIVFQMIEVHRTKDNNKYLIVDGVPFWLGGIRRVYLDKGRYLSALDDLNSIANRIKGGDYFMYLSV